MTYQSQKDFVLDYLQSGKRITALKAIGEFGIMRLAAIIHILRGLGYRILSTTKQTHLGKNYVEYYMG